MTFLLVAYAFVSVVLALGALASNRYDAELAGRPGAWIGIFVLAFLWPVLLPVVFVANAIDRRGL